MLKETHYLIIVIMVVILLMTLFTFLLTYSLMPQEDQAPRRSRPVIMLLGSEKPNIFLPGYYNDFTFKNLE
ncbi:MAG: hypothetical protein Q7J85_07995 [Bacillota bacterium]|nr:hypothetical protein [Bacillota bacterium]